MGAVAGLEAVSVLATTNLSDDTHIDYRVSASE